MYQAVFMPVFLIWATWLSTRHVTKRVSLPSFFLGELHG